MLRGAGRNCHRGPPAYSAAKPPDPKRGALQQGEETMDMTSLLIQLVSGAVGGNAAGAAMKKLSLGTVGNSIVGILGGGLGGQILGALGIGAGGDGAMDAGSIVSSIAGGGVGGAVLLAVIGAIKSAMVGTKSA